MKKIEFEAQVVPSMTYMKKLELGVYVDEEKKWGVVFDFPQMVEAAKKGFQDGAKRGVVMILDALDGGRPVISREMDSLLHTELSPDQSEAVIRQAKGL